jgi:hypothetical protein
VLAPTAHARPTLALAEDGAADYLLSAIMAARRSPLLLLSLVWSLVGCAEAVPKAESPDDAPHAERHADGAPSVSSEIGGLNEEQVNKTFESSLGALQRCLSQGSSRLELLGGSVSFFVKIDSTGAVDGAYLEKSSLGDRETEKCMLEALRAKKWPRPVGGEHGLARKSFDFDPPSDVRPPVDYDPDRLSKALSKISSKLSVCKHGPGAYEATIYVGTDGAVLAAGVTPPDERGDGAVDCMVSALKASTFPSPGSWPAKVTFAL